MQRLLQFFEGKIAYFIHLFRNKIEIYGFCNFTVFLYRFFVKVMIVNYFLYFRIYSTMLILRFQPADGELTNCSTLLTLQGKGKYIQHMYMHQNHAYIAGKGQTYPRTVSTSKIEDI